MNIVYSIGGAAITNRVNFLKEGGSFVTSAFKCEYASGGVRIEDPLGNLNIAGWDTFWVDDMDASPTRVWQGYIFDKTLSRGDLPPSGVNRVHDCDIIDLNAALQFQVLHSNDAKRPAETDVARVNWLMTSEAITGYGSNLLADLGLISAVGPVNFLAQDCRGTFANAVLRTLCEIAQKNAFAYFDGATGNAGLFYDKDASAVYSSTIRISNDLADVDGVTTFAPVTDAKLHQSGQERYGGVLFNWEGDPIYAQSPATLAAMGFSRDAVISDDKQIGDAATAEAEALSYLNTHATENNMITATILMPSASVNLLYAGMRMQVKFTHLEGYESFTWARTRTRGVRTIGVDVDGTWTVLWQVDLELWVPPVPIDDAAAGGGCDETETFGRVVADGWGTAEFASGWTTGSFSFGDAVAEVNGSAGIIRQPVAAPGGNTRNEYIVLGVRAAPLDVRFLVSLTDAVTGGASNIPSAFVQIENDFIGNYCSGEVRRKSGSSTVMEFFIASLVDGAGPVDITGAVVGDSVWVHLRMESGQMLGTVWAEGDTEPGAATLTITEDLTDLFSDSLDISCWGTVNPGDAATYYELNLCETAGAETPLPGTGDIIEADSGTFTPDGTTTTGTTTYPYIAGTLEIKIDGIWLLVADVTETNPTTGAYTLSFAPESDEIVEPRYRAS